MDSLDHKQKDSLTATNLLSHSLPWQYDLQLNLEIWKQIAKHGDIKKLTIEKKPLKLNFDYLQEYVEKAKAILKKRSQHDLLLNYTLSS